jgi:hypothetical protein
MGFDDDEDIRPTYEPIQGPPTFVRSAEMQRAYWTHNAGEQASLEARGFDALSWQERLRLHHLYCLERISPGAGRDAATQKCRLTLRALLMADSPYRPRQAMIWKGDAGSQAGRKPDLLGVLVNPSITHMGCLEVYHLDAAQQPVRMDFVSFQEASGVVFASSRLIRAAKLFYWDGREELVFVPLVYGLSWTIGTEYDRQGRMTRFVAHLEEEALASGAGTGVGQQDLSVRNGQGGITLLGLGSVGEILFPLDASDPDFHLKARARGIDPD